MAENEKAIKNWVMKNRPDLLPTINDVYASPVFEGVQVFLAIGYEAGRMFQYENPTEKPIGF